MEKHTYKQMGNEAETTLLSMFCCWYYVASSGSSGSKIGKFLSVCKNWKLQNIYGHLASSVGY